MSKTYLGDGVYADVDHQVDGQGQMVVLTTENGIRATNTIYLEPEVVGALIGFLHDQGIVI